MAHQANWVRPIRARFFWAAFGEAQPSLNSGLSGLRLTALVVGKVWVRGTWYKVEYEGLHVISGGCGCYDHVTRNCLIQKPATEAAASENTEGSMAAGKEATKEKTTGTNAGVTLMQSLGGEVNANDMNHNAPAVNVLEKVESLHGEWLVVSRKKKHLKGNPKQKEKDQGGNSKGYSNRFDVLSKGYKATNEESRPSMSKEAQKGRRIVDPTGSKKNY